MSQMSWLLPTFLRRRVTERAATPPPVQRDAVGGPHAVDTTMVVATPVRRARSWPCLAKEALD